MDFSFEILSEVGYLIYMGGGLYHRFNGFLKMAVGAKLFWIFDLNHLQIKHTQ